MNDRKPTTAEVALVLRDALLEGRRDVQMSVLDIPMVVAVARDAALAARAVEDDGSLEAAVMAIAFVAMKTAIGTGPGIPPVDELVSVVRCVINTPARELVDEQLMVRLAFDERQHVASRHEATAFEVKRRGLTNRPAPGVEHLAWELREIWRRRRGYEFEDQ